jgi:hypothetical protein
MEIIVGRKIIRAAVEVISVLHSITIDGSSQAWV